MFIRRKKNKSGSTSVQIISKSNGKYKVIKSIGSNHDNKEVQSLISSANQEIERIKNQPKLFGLESDKLTERIFSELSNASIRTVGPELVFGRIYDSIGFEAINEELFRHLVIARLAYPLSKLKTVDYLYRYQGISLDIDQVYRFLDKLSGKLKLQVEEIAFAHTLKILEGNISIVFYDMTTLYFESSDEDDLRKTGFSKDGKDRNQLIVAYSRARASKDEHNRKRGIQRLEKQIKAGKLTKSNINNKGYNKYLKMTGDVIIEIDYEKYQADEVWDGLKGYITNTNLNDKEVIDNYNNLWHIEKAFRMSKTDLRIRPIYHRLRRRIEAHICISFVAYCIYKELERVLYKENSTLSIKKAAELTHNMYEIYFLLPESKHKMSILLKMDNGQSELYNIIKNNF